MKSKFLILFLISILFVGCRGHLTEKTPFHLNPNMDWQPKIKAQHNPLKPPVETVPWGESNSFQLSETREKYIEDDSLFYTGKTSSGSWVKRAPVEVTESILKRGQERYNIHCSVCHTKTGNGAKSSIAKRGWIPSNINSELTQNRTDGELFHIVGNGIRTMPGYKKNIAVEDRWAIVLYMRALQYSNNAPYSDLPLSMKKDLK